MHESLGLFYIQTITVPFASFLFPILLLLPRTTSHITHLHANPYLQVTFLREPKLRKWVPELNCPWSFKEVSVQVGVSS
jgi:hypothetical protein